MMNLEEKAATPSSQNAADGNLSKNLGHELENRIIKEGLLKNWLRQKQLEQEVLIELFGKDMFDKCLTDMHKRDEPVIEGRQSFNTAQDCHLLLLGDHAQAGGTGGLPLEHPHLRAKNNRNGKMVLDFSARPSTPPESNQSYLNILGKDASETKRKIESPIEEQGDKTASDERKNKRNNENVNLNLREKKKAPKLLPVREKKKYQWECEVCRMINNSEEQLNTHLTGKKHLKKIKASEKNIKNVED